MIKNKTVFIVGAGASNEVGLPIGADLTKKISGLLRLKQRGLGDHISDPIISEAVHLLCQANGHKEGEYIAASKKISEAMPIAPSIDNYIHSQSGNDRIEFCSKLAIVHAILGAERNSHLYYSEANIYNTINFDLVSSTWYRQLWFLLCTDISTQNVECIFDNVVFIVFNYDRCLEQFLSQALRVYYDLDINAVQQIMGRLKIFHPYGQVGQLPAMTSGGNVSYGFEPSARNLVVIAQLIKTFTERVEESTALKTFQDEIANSRKLVFLGFAFHELNMKLLKCNSNIGSWEIYGTRYRMSDSAAQVITGRIRSIFAPVIVNPDIMANFRAEAIARMPANLLNGKCSELFAEYGMNME